MTEWDSELFQTCMTLLERNCQQLDRLRDSNRTFMDLVAVRLKARFTSEYNSQDSTKKGLQELLLELQSEQELR